MLALMLWTIIIGILFYYYAIKPMSYWKNRGVQQGNPVWLFGDFWKIFVMSLAELVKEAYGKFPNVRYSGLYSFKTPILIIHDPDLLKQVTVKYFDHFLDRGPFVPEEADPLWGKNLLALTGQRWKTMRSVLSPSFTSSKMRTIFTLIVECSNAFVKHFSKEEIVDVEMKEVVSRFGNDVIASTAFGVKVDSFKEPNNEFYLMGKRATDFSGFLISVKFILFMIVPKVMSLFKITLFSKEESDFFLNIIDETIKAREEKNIVRKDMIHLMLEAKKGKSKQYQDDVIDTGFATVHEISTDKKTITNKITNTDIASQAVSFLFAGFESVSVTICFTTYELALHPDIQKILRDEINETNSICNGKLTYEALMKMKYLDMVVSESLRKWPPFVAVDRVCTKPFKIEPKNPGEKPLYLEEGNRIWLAIFGFQRDPKYYPDPERFDPERFNDENKESINPYTYMPFGLGPRNCIGSRFALLEIKTFLYHLLLNFEIVPNEKTPIPAVIVQKTFNTSIKGGFNLRLKRINHDNC